MRVSAEPIDLLIVTGGPGSEHDVSLASAASATTHLDAARYRVTTVILDRAGRWCDASGTPLPRRMEDLVRLIQRADVVLPLMHGKVGEDGSLAAVLDACGTPYVGSGVRAGAVAIDKHLMKLLASDAGIPVAAGVLVDGREVSPPFDPPMFIKPNTEGSSYGIQRVSMVEDFAAAVAEAAAFDPRVLVEKEIVGREIDIAVLQMPDGTLRVGPPLEIIVEAGGFFGTAEKYDGGATFLVPASIPDKAAIRLRDHAEKLFRLLGCAGVARFDFFLTDDGGLVLNEVNTAPGMTAASQVPRMFDADGLPYPRLLDTLIDTAMAVPRVADHPADLLEHAVDRL
ncbi:D-alanine--D-alanine ligase [Stackebrandtia endophytica]|uniref:D-alanine--D-alanine ligase n=1 Tax=Stackebrandtia endophytica TaxID=1496996 RepID=A0A543B3S7_9ACTN|nr:D-alanine--D-alanine ligase [Stackebrandtia endophytica]TQL79420.1 D-alanine--D-alanine ligase [Stackebrandtia endophytica]